MTAFSDLVRYQGKTVNRGTLAILDAANQILKSPRFGAERSPVTLIQGSYSGGVSASAGTHNAGGAIDITPHNWRCREEVFRMLGVAMWNRPTLVGVWAHHMHGIVDGDGTAAPSAKRQVTAYHGRRNGLANNGPDLGYQMKVFPLFVAPWKSSGRTGVYYLRRSVRARTQPTTAARSLGLMPSGGKFTIVARVRVGDQYWAINPNGYCVPVSDLTSKKPGRPATPKPLLSKPHRARYRITATTLNARSGPGTNYPIMGSAKKGAVFTSDRRSNDGKWLRSAKTKYWYSASYLARA